MWREREKTCRRRRNGHNMEAKTREMAASQVRPPGGGSAGGQFRDWVEMERGKIGF